MLRSAFLPKKAVTHMNLASRMLHRLLRSYGLYGVIGEPTVAIKQIERIRLEIAPYLCTITTMAPDTRLKKLSKTPSVDALPPMPFQDRCVEHPISKRWILLPDVDEQHPLTQWKSIAKSGGHVLLTGEAGLGLEDIAVLIAANSIRPLAKFRSINCTHYSESTLDSEFFGQILAAMSGGTIFLDALDQTTKTFQAKLLRFIERGEYQPVGGDKTKKANVRIIVATQSSQALLTNLQHQFGCVIPVPPLRDRPHDIIRQLLRFMWPYDIYTGISPQLLLTLCCYSWPGNERELQSMCQRVQATPPATTIKDRHILLYAPVDDNYRCFPPLPRNDVLSTMHTMLMLYALRRHLGLEPTAFRRDETNNTLRLLLEIEDESAGYHPNFGLEKIAQCWESPALYDLSNFDSADQTPSPEYGSLSLPDVLDLLRNYCCQSNAHGPRDAVALLLEQQGPENQPDIKHWEFMAARQYVTPPSGPDPLQQTWGEILSPSEDRKRCAEAVHHLADVVEPSEIEVSSPLPDSRCPATNQRLERVIDQPQLVPMRINIVQLAEKLGKSQRTIAEWKRRRIIPFEKIGRNVMFDVAAVDAALKKYRRNAAGD